MSDWKSIGSLSPDLLRDLLSLLVHLDLAWVPARDQLIDEAG